MHIIKTYLALVTLTAVLFATTSVHAYGYESHARIVQRAADAMRWSPFLSVPTPPGVDTVAFQNYITNAFNAIGSLRHLKTGLPNKLPKSGFQPIPNERYESYPFQATIVSLVPLQLSYPTTCGFDATDNLSDLSEFRIEDFHYYPHRSADPCGLEYQNPYDDDPSDPDAQGKILGRVLGWHAMKIDEHHNDSVLWFKPMNAAGASAIKDIASKAWEGVAGSILVIGYCFVKLLTGKICDPDDMFELARQYNPVEWIDGWTPGFGDVRGDDYTGLWHFIEIEQEDEGEFNYYPGMDYLTSGPGDDIFEGPGALDLGIIAWAELSGLSLNAGASDGDDFYGDFDEVNRPGPIPWQAYNIAHIEFSPIDNLAMYGWKKYIDEGAFSAEGLGWPLHAIGDVTVPQHVVPTTGHGHRPYEQAIENDQSGYIFPPENTLQIADQYRRAIIAGYEWWEHLQQYGDIERFIEDLAFETLQYVHDNGDWVFNGADKWSTLYEVGNSSMKSLAESAFYDDHDKILPLVETAMGATIAFLIHAAAFATNTGPGNIKCPTGTVFSIPDNGCISGTPPPPGSICASGQQTCQDAECPEGYACTDGCCWVIIL